MEQESSATRQEEGVSGMTKGWAHHFCLHRPGRHRRGVVTTPIYSYVVHSAPCDLRRTFASTNSVNGGV